MEANESALQGDEAVNNFSTLEIYFWFQESENPTVCIQTWVDELWHMIDIWLFQWTTACHVQPTVYCIGHNH